MTQWTLQPILESYTVVFVLTALLAATLLVAPVFRRLSPRRRWGLLALRAVVVLLMVLAMLRPTRISSTTKPQTAVLLILFDQSRSMQLPHASGGKSRWEAQVAALQRAQQQLGSLMQDTDVKLYAYDQQLHAVELGADAIGVPAEPGGQQTDIGSVLDEAVQRELGRRVAAVVLLGDGAQTAFAPKVEVQEAGRTLARLEYPLYTVAFGPPGDVGQSRDVSVENLPEQYSVFVKNELPVRGSLRVRGYVNQEIPVELLVEDAAGNVVTVGTARPRSREDGQQIPLEIPFTPAEPGQYKLTLRATEQDGELVTRNNQLSAFLTVLEGGLRVLYLYGDLMGEQRLLRRSIDASPDMQLDDVFVDPRNRDRWPIDLREFMSTSGFDVLLLESVDVTALGETNLEAIAKSVESGRGLMMIGGFNSFGPGGFYGTPLADVLPITMGRFDRQDVDVEQPISRDLHLWGDLPMLPVRAHPVTRLANEGENTSLWRSLPTLQGANLFESVKPRSMVLAETPSGDPLLVSGEYGRGRVLAFAGNSSRRWWQYGRKMEHRRFWRQVILWLARRDEAERNDVWIKLQQRRYNPGARIPLTAGANSAAGDVIRDADYEMQLLRPDGTREPIRFVNDGDQVAATLEGEEVPGDYLIEVEVSKNGQPLGQARANFQVLDRDLELSNPAANYDLMERLANLTKDAGGRAVAPEQLPQLLEEIEERRPEMQIEVQSKWQLADTALDAWLFLLLVVGLLGAEWGLRKHWGLV
jgi:uncharacterized membrane protein